jgi:hypothetical protein
VKPVLQALVVADRVYEDRNGKKIIVGTFNSWGFSKRPPISCIENDNGTSTPIIVGGMQAGSPFAYLSLTDICVGTKLTLRFVNLTKNQVLFGTDVTIAQPVDRLQMVELVFPLPVLPITEAGTYALEILCEDEILGSWRILGVDMDSREKKGE